MLALLALASGGACARVRPAPVGPTAPSCALGTGARAPGDTLTVAAMEPVDPSRAPAPTNGAERLVFAQLYATLLEVDCAGLAHPALAESWTLDATRTRITLTLRDDARFWSGAPLTADDAVAAWRAAAARSTESARLARDVAAATTVFDSRTLSVSLPDTDWLVLADPALAVYRASPAGSAGWPEGSGAYHPADVSRDGLLLAPRSPGDPHLFIRYVPGGDVRDAVDAGADVIVTGDPAGTAYAASRPSFAVVPLPWTRTYALAVPARGAWAAALPDSAIDQVRAGLARDAVRADARPAQPSPWTSAGAPCGPTLLAGASPPAAVARSKRVLYRRDDAAARGIAERLVALQGDAVAAGLPAADFARALRTGADLGYVLELPREPLEPCRALADLYSEVPWLPYGGGVPLIDVREHAIVRGAVPASITWDGTLLFGASPAGSRP